MSQKYCLDIMCEEFITQAGVRVESHWSRSHLFGSCGSVLRYWCWCFGTLSWVRAGVVTVVFYRAFNCLILACFSCVELLLWLLSRWWSLLFRPIDHRLQSPWMAKGSGWRWRVSKVPWLWYVRRNQRSRNSSRSCSQRKDFQNTNHRADICSCNWPLW